MAGEHRIYCYEVTLLVYCSRHSLYARMWRMFRYMLSHFLSNLRTIRQGLTIIYQAFVSLRVFPHEFQLSFVTSSQTALCSG